MQMSHGLRLRPGTGEPDPLPQRAAEAIEYAEFLPRVGENVRLRYPLKLECMQQADDNYEVYSPALRIGGVGSSWEAALRDLACIAWSLLDEFEATANADLHQSALAKLDRLRKYLANGP